LAARGFVIKVQIVLERRVRTLKGDKNAAYSKRLSRRAWTEKKVDPVERKWIAEGRISRERASIRAIELYP